MTDQPPPATSPPPPPSWDQTHHDIAVKQLEVLGRISRTASNIAALLLVAVIAGGFALSVALAR